MRTNLMITIVLVFVLISCRRDYGDPRQPPLPGNEEELITTFKLGIRDSASGAIRTYFFRDDDGELNNGGAYYGPDKLTQTDSAIMLKAHGTYYCEITLLNELVLPADTVSHEIKEKADEHMLFYDPKKNGIVNADPYTIIIEGTGLKIVYLDKDNRNLPLGLQTKWFTGSAEVLHGFDIVLKHQQDGKNGKYDVGETELQINFSLEVK